MIDSGSNGVPGIWIERGIEVRVVGEDGLARGRSTQPVMPMPSGAS